ncbi:conserved hypothetical protein [Uncinocarpus reesii 1704]|uniref:Guanine nucleotide-exchange factor SEC12 n=1 Tax=Uncinocarpus reesii (strain UAMH 1704) TaxID=336963 RepID=C4JMV2_UNCRE|nr:uncharacterized protein UREG_04160 [Uncinocarpus reesii 1704]EEP79314.1 conserved hypothetical protein [Uncinocarpus reesii 1704]
MAPPVSSSKITLSCPLFAADFDPQNNGLLLVAGGGGEGRSGVGNKISLLNTAHPNKITELVEVGLSRDEDSVMSLGIAQSSHESLVAFTGINSSQAEQKQNNNEHLRSFKLNVPRVKPTADSSIVDHDTLSKSEKAPQTTPLSRASLFRTRAVKDKKDQEAYQRILRLSPWKGSNSPRIAAIATGLAPQGEIVVFNANTSTPQESDVIGRVTLGNQEEAEDLDILDVDNEGNFRLVYSNGPSLYMCDVSASKKAENLQIECIYTVPPEGGRKPKIRAVRFLSPTSFAFLQNSANRSGCEVAVLTLKGSRGSVTRRRRLHSSMKIGVGLDVCRLPQSSKDLHPFSMTRIAFSNFIPPSHPVTADVKPQYIKLASVSVGNTVVEHTLPLSPYPTGSKRPRYVLVTPGPSEILQNLFSIIMAVIVVGLGAFCLQAFTEIRGGVPPTLGAKEWLHPRLRDLIARPYMFEDGRPGQQRIYSLRTSTASTVTQATETPVIQTPTPPLRDFLSSKDDSQTLFIQDHGDHVRVHEHKGDGQNQEGRKWEDLPHEEREAWKTKLADYGHWAAEEGEAILRDAVNATSKTPEKNPRACKEERIVSAGENGKLTGQVNNGNLKTVSGI